MTTSFTLVSQRAIWNPGYVFAWPNLNTAPVLKGASQLGISLVWGGNKNYANGAVGDLTTSPLLLDGIVTSDADCNCGRWGDYLAVDPTTPPRRQQRAPSSSAPASGTTNAAATTTSTWPSPDKQTRSRALARNVPAGLGERPTQPGPQARQ